MNINITKTKQNAIIPTRGSKCAAGYDLYAALGSEVEIVKGGQTRKIETGVAMEIPEGYFGAIFARSGLATKQGLRPANCVGVIDSDYRGEIIVALHNDSSSNKTIYNGDRIAQIVIMPFLFVEFNEVDNLSSTDRGDGGFGSTGVKQIC